MPDRMIRRLLRRAWIVGAVIGVQAAIVAPAKGAPPTLEPPQGETLPATLQAGKTHLFRMIYRDPDGDRPQSLMLVAEAPNGTNRLPLPPPTGDSRSGVTAEWSMRFDLPGLYKIHFEGASTAGRRGVPETRWPASGTIEVTVIDPLTQWIMLAIGLAVSLLFLPMMVFFVARGALRRSDPGATARFALLVGILAAATWYAKLFWYLHGMTTIIVVAIVALGAIFVLATMRR